VFLADGNGGAASNGVELHVEVHGDGDPVLLLHGWPDDAGLWRHQVPALTAAGFLVIAPDLRGRAPSSRNWYRANLAPRMPGQRQEFPPVLVPALGTWSDGDRYLDGARMRASGDLVKGPWRYAEIGGASHWIPLDAPEELNALLLDWLSAAS
jgi:pimeloyl-ACP methyl ester carboxylesterase